MNNLQPLPFSEKFTALGFVRLSVVTVIVFIHSKITVNITHSASIFYFKQWKIHCKNFVSLFLKK